MSATIPRLWFAPTLSSANNSIEFTARADSLGAGAANAYTGTLGAAQYVEPHPNVSGSLLDELGDEILAATRAGPGTYTGDSGTVAVSLSSDGVVTITLGGLLNGSNATMLWNSGSAAMQALATILGFDNSADDVVLVAGNVAAFEADWPMRHLWHPSCPPRKQAEEPLDIWASVAETASGKNKTWYWGAFTNRPLVFEWIAPERARANAATGANTNLDLETLWNSELTGRIRYWSDKTTVEAAGASLFDGDYFLAEEAAQKYDPQRASEALAYYTVNMPLRGLVT